MRHLNGGVKQEAEQLGLGLRGEDKSGDSSLGSSCRYLKHDLGRSQQGVDMDKKRRYLSMSKTGRRGCRIGCVSSPRSPRSKETGGIEKQGHQSAPFQLVPGWWPKGWVL